MNEIDKHYLIFDSPHIYRCSCGIAAYIFSDEEKIFDMPTKEIEYLPCGHAICARTSDYDCIICARTT